MGSHMKLFAGPFVVGVVNKEKLSVDKTKSVLTCIHKHCKLWNTDVFAQFGSKGILEYCPRCGTKLETIQQTYKAPRFFAYDVIDHIDERFFLVDIDKLYNINVNENDEFHIFLPNVKVDGLERNMFFDGRSATILEDGEAHFEEDIFKKFFEKELEMMKDYYDKVHVYWGILTYWS